MRLLAVLAFFAAAAPAHAIAAGEGALTLYDERQWRGDSLRLTTEAADLSRLGFGGRAVSLRLASGPWEVCSQPYFEGVCEVMTMDRRDLGALGWADAVRSARPLRPGEPLLTLYSSVGYAGEARSFARAVDDLAELGFAGRAWSARPQGASWRLCAKAELGGRCRLISGPARNLSQIGLGGRVSSFARSGGALPPEPPEPPTPGPGWGWGPPVGVARSRLSPPDFVNSEVGLAVFNQPGIDGRPVDGCVDGKAAGCGAPAAQAFCWAAGYGRAASFRLVAHTRGSSVYADTGRRNDRPVQRLAELRCAY